MLKQDKESSGWERVSDYHLTQLFLGSKEPRDDEQWAVYNSFQANKEVDLTIQGFLVVEGKIAVGICFPPKGYKVENPLPHVTIAIN